MAGIHLNIPIPPESAIASYDFFDLATGVGYKEFYAMDGVNDTTNEKGLITFATIKANNGSTTAGAGVTLDFDMVANSPLTLQGNAYVQTSWAYDTLGSGDTITTYVKLYKVSGGTPTQLGATQTISELFTSSGTTYTTRTGKMVIPLTLLKIGDTLRLEVVLPSYTGGGKYWQLQHNPNGVVATGQQTTQTKLLLPIKIDR
jgi:hypothetical protein